MKDAIITVRLPRATRRRLETLAQREGRSLSQQVERLVEQGLLGTLAPPLRGARTLSGRLRIGRVPSLADFRQARAQLSTSLAGRLAGRGQRRR
jgi:CopG antitoxin of type II toxin-antitoxin system